MILLNFRVHRAGVNNFARCWRNPRRISFQRHPAFRAITRLVGLNAGTHRAKILCGRRGVYCRVAVAVMGMPVMFVAATTIAGDGRGFSLAATTGMFLRTVLVFALAAATIAGVAGVFGIPSTATNAVRFSRRVLRKKLLPAMFAAKIKRLSAALSVERRRFIHRHAADGVGGHIHQTAAASFMILTIAASTSCATPFSCGVLNSASRVVGFKVARMVLPPSS